MLKSKTGWSIAQPAKSTLANAGVSRKKRAFGCSGEADHGSIGAAFTGILARLKHCLLYTSPSPRDSTSS
eukprot:9268559-Prorocentrum_lima.AAC.1